MSNQRAIAAALGLTQATVSRALRNDPSISQSTQERVAEEARKMGYLPNPVISTLMERIRAGKTVHEQGCLAILVDAKSESDWLVGETYELQYKGMMSRARLRGYRTECFFLRSAELSRAKIDRILYARGIKGIIFAAPSRESTKSIDLRWERYAAATMGSSWPFLEVDRAGSNLRSNVVCAFNELLRRGYRRIGLSLHPSALNPDDSLWLGGFLARQFYLPESDKIPIFFGFPKTDPLDKFRDWYLRWRPDSLLCLKGEELLWLEQLGISPMNDLGIVCLNRPIGSKLTGIDENSFHVGEATCDLVVDHIMRNDLGLRPHPHIVLIHGSWLEGDTLPKIKPSTGGQEPLVDPVPC